VIFEENRGQMQYLAYIIVSGIGVKLGAGETNGGETETAIAADRTKASRSTRANSGARAAQATSTGARRTRKLAAN
jgi:hypothetical protein